MSSTWMSDFGTAVTNATAETNLLMRSIVQLRGHIVDTASALREVARATSNVASGVGARGGSGGGISSGGGGGGGGDSILQQANQLSHVLKDVALGSSEVAKITKEWGFGAAAAQLTTVAERLRVVSAVTRVSTDAVGLFTSAWKPAAVSLGLVLGGLLAVQKILQASTGTKYTIIDTINIGALSIAKAFNQARLAVDDFLTSFADKNSPDLPTLAADAAQAQSNIEGTQHSLDELERHAQGNTGGGGFSGFMREVADAVKLAGDNLAKLLPDFNATGERTNQFLSGLRQAQLELAKLGGDQATIDAARRDALAAEIRRLTDEQRALATQGAAPDDERIATLEKEKTVRQQILEATIAQEHADETVTGRLKKAVGDMTNLSKGLMDFAVHGVEQLSGTIASSLLSAFLDPQQSIKQSFASLFRALAEQLLALTIQALLFKAILGAGSALAGSSFGGAGSIVSTLTGAFTGGHAAGGLITDHRAPASFAHFGPGAQAFSLGGRPHGLPASDTVPAWLTPGEFVEPVSAVQRYGAGFMEAVRSLAFPVDVARAFSSGLQSIPPPASHSGQLSFASGGRVPSAGSAAIGSGVLPIMVGTARNAQEFLTQGRVGVERAQRASAARTRATLGVRRG